MPNVFDFFFAQIRRGLTLGISILNEFIDNSITAPFMKLFLVVFAFAMIMKYVIYPLLFDSGSSDKVKKSRKKKDNE